MYRRSGKDLRLLAVGDLLIQCFAAAHFTSLHLALRGMLAAQQLQHCSDGFLQTSRV